MKTIETVENMVLEGLYEMGKLTDITLLIKLDQCMELACKRESTPTKDELTAYTRLRSSYEDIRNLYLSGVYTKHPTMLSGDMYHLLNDFKKCRYTYKGEILNFLSLEMITAYISEYAISEDSNEMGEKHDFINDCLILKNFYSLEELLAEVVENKGFTNYQLLNFLSYYKVNDIYSVYFK